MLWLDAQANSYELSCFLDLVLHILDEGMALSKYVQHTIVFVLHDISSALSLKQEVALLVFSARISIMKIRGTVGG